MVKTDEPGPDSPLPWTTDHVTLGHTLHTAGKGKLKVLLKDLSAPHERAAVYRMNLLGFPGSVIKKMLGLQPLQLSQMLSEAVTEENNARRRMREVCGGP